jgi:hypothetical protein
LAVPIRLSAPTRLFKLVTPPPEPLPLKQGLNDKWPLPSVARH